MKKAVLLVLIVLLVLPCSVFAVSYVDLERTTVGSLDDRYGISLDGVNDYVNISDSSSLDVTKITILTWVNLSSAPSTRGDVISKTGAGDDTYRLTIDNVFNVKWSIKIGGTPYEDIFSNSPLTLNTMYRIGYTFNGTILKGFVNGDQQSFTRSVSGDIATNNIDFRIGCIWSGVYHLNATIDEVLIANRAWNTTEITYDYNNGVGRHTPLNQTGLVAWWHFNEGTENTVYDETENDNDGTIYGASWISGKVQSYLPYVTITELEASYDAKFYDSLGVLVANGSANSGGTAILTTIAESYLGSAFEGTFRVYDTNSSFLYSKWIEDVHGGDTYEIKQETSKGFVLAVGILALFIGVPLFALIWRGKR